MKKIELLAARHEFKLTQLRADILSILIKTKKPLTAYQMLERIQKVRANAKPPTVYRVLDFFIEKGLVHRLDKYNAYTLCQLKHEHTSNKQRIDILLVCKYCMKIVEFSDLVLAALVKKIQAEKRVIIENQEIELHCVCSGCAKSQ
jgi:Fur family transcriptional regulator, zinc uptake regulator